MNNSQIYQEIAKSNRLFRDFGINERMKITDWKNSSVIAIENYRKSKIHNYLNDVIENNRMDDGKLR